ncbi:MAG: hypothetical protein ACOYN0_04075 [Phycisphaerales bacterium]
MGYRLVACAAITAVASSIASADVISLWNIVTPFPTGAGNVPTGLTYSAGAADTGLLTAGSELTSVHSNAAATYTSPVGNASALSFSSNNWGIGDYYQARVSTLGYTGISVSWDQARSATGPASFTLLLSVDNGANWTTLVASYGVVQSGGGGSPATWTSSGVRNPLYTLGPVSTGGLADNQSTVLFRFQALSAGTAASGSNRIDNVEITGVPTPGAIALVGLGGLIAGRRRR